MDNESPSDLSNQVAVEKFPTNDMSTGSNTQYFKPLNKKTATLLDSETPKKKKEASKTHHRPVSMIGSSNNGSKANVVSPSEINMPPSAMLNSSTIQNENVASLMPPILPPMPPPPMLPSQISTTTSNTIGANGNPNFISPYAQFPTAPSCSYYFQQPSSATPSIQSASSSSYDKSAISHSKTSSINEYPISFVNQMPETSICGAVPNITNSSTLLYQQPSSSSSSNQTEVTSMSQPQASILSHQMIPPMFTPTMMNMNPVASVSSVSSMNCNMNDASASDINSSTPLSSVNYNIHPQMNTSMPFQDTSQSFSIDSNHGIPPPNQHLPTSFNSPINICQNPNAIEFPLYHTDGEISYPYCDQAEAASIMKKNKENQFKQITSNGITRHLRERQRNISSHKNNSKKSSASLAVRHKRNIFNNANTNAETTGVIENSDGYTSSVSHSSARNSSQILSSISGSTKMYKGTSSQQILSAYPKQVSNKPKQYKCQSLDRSSDSDFTSQLSETSKKKDLTSSMRTCDLCKLTFPSPSVLDNHLKGSKHTRKVKSQQAFRQLQDNGTNLRQNIIHEDGTFEEDLHFGEISCEVCEVSVNSSHQLQAHLAGKY